jgi:hypothetical protein
LSSRKATGGNSGQIILQPNIGGKQRRELRRNAMQKGNLYEAIFIVNRGIDDAVSALERLKIDRGAGEVGLSPAFLDQKLIEFEMHRASLNGYFANHLDSAEEADAAELSKKYQPYRRKDLDEVKVYQDVELLEQRRCMEGKGPRVRFLSKEELHISEGVPPKPNPSPETTCSESKEPRV